MGSLLYIRSAALLRVVRQEDLCLRAALLRAAAALLFMYGVDGRDTERQAAALCSSASPNPSLSLSLSLQTGLSSGSQQHPLALGLPCLSPEPCSSSSGAALCSATSRPPHGQSLFQRRRSRDRQHRTLASSPEACSSLLRSPFARTSLAVHFFYPVKVVYPPF